MKIRIPFSLSIVVSVFVPAIVMADCPSTPFPCLQSSVDGNSGFGTSALSSNTEGGNNTALGYEALISNTSGASNTATGAEALHENTTGEQNTAQGDHALYSNSTGTNNTASGWRALYSNTTGGLNTATGAGALYHTTVGEKNTASGQTALHFNTSGKNNTATGTAALYNNTTGIDNAAFGFLALMSNTNGGSNSALGNSSLSNNTTGRRNTGVGFGALSANTTGSDNIAIGMNASSAPKAGFNNILIGNVGTTTDTKTIRIGKQGTQLKTFIGGIRGTTVSGAAVLVSTTGQLGVQSSSRRHKENIRPMADASVALMKLRPVTFLYKEADADGNKPVQFGLIAEEVAEVLPELVVRDDKGQPETVAYHVLPSLLLNEYQKQQVKLADVTTRAEQDHAQLVDVTAREVQLRDALAARDKELAAMHTEITALRQVTQQLMAAMPSATTVGMTEQ